MAVYLNVREMDWIGTISNTSAISTHTNRNYTHRVSHKYYVHTHIPITCL